MAAGYRARLEAGMTAHDGDVLDPIVLELTRLGPGIPPGTDGVGVGIGTIADGDALQVVRIVPGSGEFDAGVEFGDHIVAIDGIPVTRLGADRAFASLRGQPGTTVALTLRRAARYIQLVVERRLLGS